MRDETFTWRATWLKSDLFRGIRLSEQFLYWKKCYFYCFWVPRETNLRFCSKTQWRMFLLVSGRHVGAHPHGLQHGVSIQISNFKFGKKASPHISHKKNCCDLNLGESLCIVTFVLFSGSRLKLWNGFDFYFDLFWIAWLWKPAIGFLLFTTKFSSAHQFKNHIELFSTFLYESRQSQV